MNEFHDIGAQVGQSLLPGRGLAVTRRGGRENPAAFAMSTAYALGTLTALLLLAWTAVRWGTRRRKVARRPRWDGGVRRLPLEMTYTAAGFSNLVRVIFDATFRPTTVEETRETVAEHFRTAIRRRKEQACLADRFFLRLLQAAALWLSRALAAMHHGRINAYIAYVLPPLLAALALILL